MPAAMLTLTSEYALRALVFLARHAEECPIPGRRIAEEARIPAKYLLKVLGDLVRAGVLESTPGKHGGFRLRRSARQTTLLDVLSPFEPFEHGRCPFGHGSCDDDQPCAVHHTWKRVIETERRFLRETSLSDVAAKTGTGAVDSVRYRKNPVPKRKKRPT